MEELKQLKQLLEQERPVNWDELPDLALYMDQIISYMPRQLINLQGDEQVTSAMVNNYIKDGLVPRAEGKRYGKTHLGYLTAVCAMKKVLSVKDMRTMLDFVPENKRPEAIYNYFVRAIDTALSEAAANLNVDTPEDELPNLALSLGLRSYANQLACQRVLELMLSKHPEKQEKTEKEKKKDKEKEKKDHE
ncbi:MAG: DUF1836 domain-containing protein [Oscillospiraceae bacterium]|nr:DUF1836 domain-containing protein [Oscillospiraceae bacterium]